MIRLSYLYPFPIRTALAGLSGLLFLTTLLTAAPVTNTYPKPDLETVFPELKITTVDGLPYRQPVEDWMGARQRIKDGDAWKNWFEEKKIGVDEWMSRQQDDYTWKAGDWRDFTSPGNGAALVWTPENPSISNKLVNTQGKTVANSPEIQEAWVFGFRMRHAMNMEDAAMIYRCTGDTRYAAWVASQVDYYATNLTRWSQAAPNKSILMALSLDEASLLIRHLNAVHTLGDYPRPEQTNRWYQLYFSPQANHFLKETIRPHHIACWHLSAAGHVALYFKDESLWKRVLNDPFGLHQQIAMGITSDYLWYEQSFVYAEYVIQGLLPLLEYAVSEGRSAEIKTELLAVENMMLAPIYLRFPDGSLPKPTELTQAIQAPDISLLASASRLFPTTVGLQSGARTLNWKTLLDPLPSPKSVPLPEVTSRNMESSRMALIKKGSWQIFYHYGQIASSHIQPEALSYEAYYKDVPLTLDSGVAPHNSHILREFFSTSIAHNVPLFYESGQQRAARGELLDFDAANGQVSARQPEYLRFVEAKRTLHVEGDKLIDTVNLTPSRQVRPDTRFALITHLQGRFELGDAFVPQPSFATTNHGTAFKYFSEPRTASFTNQATLPLICGEQRFKVTVKVAGPFTLTSASNKVSTNSNCLYVETIGTNASFTTIFEPKNGN